MLVKTNTNIHGTVQGGQRLMPSFLMGHQLLSTSTLCFRGAPLGSSKEADTEGDSRARMAVKGAQPQTSLKVEVERLQTEVN